MFGFAGSEVCYYCARRGSYNLAGAVLFFVWSVSKRAWGVPLPAVDVVPCFLEAFKCRGRGTGGLQNTCWNFEGEDISKIHPCWEFELFRALLCGLLLHPIKNGNPADRRQFSTVFFILSWWGTKS